MNWFILVIAGLFEIAWAIGLKYTEGFTRLWPTVGTLLAVGISVRLLGIAITLAQSARRFWGSSCLMNQRMLGGWPAWRLFWRALLA